MYLDIHAHFAGEGYAFPEGWERIRAAGVTRVVLAGDTLAHSAWHAEFCQSYEGAYFTAGVHPSDLAGFGQQTLDELARLCGQEKCIAVGEIGLDYHYPAPEKSVQRAAFIAQLELAHRLGLPVQIHSRDCFADMIAILTEHRALLSNGFLMHCYSHGAQNMEEVLQLGGYFSFGGVACFKNAKNVWESVRACPADRILSETDSPYLSPFRGEKNSPANIPVIVRRLAELRGEDEENLQNTIWENAGRLFPKIG